MQTIRMAAASIVFACLFAWSLGLGYAAPILDVDFDSMTPGATTKGALDAATTGGTWNLDTTTTGVSNSIESDGGGQGDKAFLTVFDAVGTSQFGSAVARIDLNSAVDIDGDLTSGDLQINFKTVDTSGVGFTRKVYYRLYDGATELVEIMVANEYVGGGGSYDRLFLNGVSQGDSPGVGLKGPGTGLSSWDSTNALVNAVSIAIDSSGNLGIDFGSESGSTTIDSNADIDRFEIEAYTPGYTDLGVYLNDVSFEIASAALIPEPTTLLIWSLLAGLGVGLGWRRRK